MKLKFTIVIFLLLHNFVSSAQLNQLLGSSSNQSLTSKSGKTAHSGSPKSSNSKNNITGIWRGYFIQKDYNPRTGKFEEDRYKYEVQINNLSNNSLEGVTYSYHTTTFYGKAALQGIFTTETKNIVIKETKMLELKIAGFSEPCLMTCYLDYAKAGKTEILKGEYSSQNMQSKAACGNGTVYLEKVPDTEFEKEDFLLKKTAPLNTPLAKKENNKINIAPKPKTIIGNNEKGAITKSRFKPGAEDALVKDKNTLKKDVVVATPEEIKKKPIETIVAPKKEIIQPAPIPVTELTDRKNDLVKTLYVDEGELIIELYDNGEVDNDTVSIYHNGSPVILHGRLTTHPLQIKIEVNSQNPIHELVMVADNLGTIPPNTALMLVTAGKKTYQVFLTSDLQRNAKVIFEYKPQNDEKKK